MAREACGSGSHQIWSQTFHKADRDSIFIFVNLASIISEVKVALSITGSLMASKKLYGAATFYSVDYLSPDL